MKDNNTQIDKEIFVASKAHDLLTMDKGMAEASVQTHLDNAIGKDRIRFELRTIDDAVAMFFHRGFDYGPCNTDPTEDIIDADAFMITTHGYEGFMVPVPFLIPPVPGFGYPYHIGQTDFLGTCCKSARILGTSKMKNAPLDIGPVSVVLRVQIE